MSQSESSGPKTPQCDLEKTYGKGVTPASLLAMGRVVSARPSRSQQKAIESMLAAEDAMRAAEEGEEDPSERAMWEAINRKRAGRKRG
jgi:hypothetical protein